MVEPTKRELTKLWSLIRKAGSRAELIRWMRNYPEPKSGRPRNTSLDVFLDMIAEYHGPGWNLDRKGKIAALKTYGIRIRPFTTPHATIRHYVEKMWRDHTKMSRDKTLPAAARAAWDPKHLGKSPNAITRRLTSELRKRAKTRKPAM